MLGFPGTFRLNATVPSALSRQGCRLVWEAGGCGGSTLTPGRVGWSRGHGSGVPPSAQRHPPGEGATAPGTPVTCLRRRSAIDAYKRGLNRLIAGWVGAHEVTPCTLGDEARSEVT